MQNEEQIRNEQGDEQEAEKKKDNTENPADKQADDWRSGLREFFKQVAREDETFADHTVQVERFYKDVARPALDEACGELKLYGRECETGEDRGRAFIIVRDAKHQTEFQYAVAVEVKIETITPYVHCWYEETPPSASQGEQVSGNEQSDAQQNEAQSQSNGDDGKKDQAQKQDHEKDQNDESGGKEQDGENKKDDESKKGDESGQQGGKESSGDKSGGENSGDDKSGDDKSSDGKTSGEPKRTKTIELLAGWSEERKLDSVTREEIINDFVAHYKNAVARKRAPLHRAQEKD